MSFFIYDDKIVGPKGGDSIEQLTKAEYDALPDDVKNDGSIRLIVDSEGVVPGGGYEPDGRTIRINSDNKLEAATFVGATSTVNGRAGIAPTPFAGDQNKFLCGDGTWKEAGSTEDWKVLATSDAGKVYYRKVNGVVYLEWRWWTVPAVDTIIATLPEGYRLKNLSNPTRGVQFYIPASGTGNLQSKFSLVEGKDLKYLGSTGSVSGIAHYGMFSYPAEA